MKMYNETRNKFYPDADELMLGFLDESWGGDALCRELSFELYEEEE